MGNRVKDLYAPKLCYLNFLADIFKVKRPIIAIDFQMYIYRSLMNNHQNGYLYYILNLIEILISNNITPIFVFDGKPSNYYKHSLTTRKKKRNKNVIQIEKDQNLIDLYNENFYNFSNEFDMFDNELYDILIIYNKYYQKIIKLENSIQKRKKQLVSINKTVIDNIKYVFDCLGIMYIHNEKQEADIMCALLVKQGLANAVLSNDSDLLSYNGVKYVLSDLNFRTSTVKCYDTYNVDLTPYQRIDFAILSGTLGPSFNYKLKYYQIRDLLQTHNNIEGVLEYCEKGYEYCNPKFKDYDFQRQRDILNIPDDISKEIHIYNQNNSNFNKTELINFIMFNSKDLKKDVLNRKVYNIIRYKKVF